MNVVRFAAVAAVAAAILAPTANAGIDIKRAAQHPISRATTCAAAQVRADAVKSNGNSLRDKLLRTTFQRCMRQN